MWLLDSVGMIGGKLLLLGERSLLFVEVGRELGSVDGDVENFASAITTGAITCLRVDGVASTTRSHQCA